MISPSYTVAPVNRDDFLDVVRAAQLFTPLQFGRVETAVANIPTTAGDTAHALVAAGLITNFQADRLLAGRTDGFHLGPYVIQEQVGRGRSGRVYKAKHRTMNRYVAIKVLSAELTRTTADRETFQLEVRSTAQLNHPNIVTAYDANELEDRFYLVLEFVNGPNLETLIRERGPLPVSEACNLVRQAALGLAHAHAHAIVHRDIKPTNLIITRPSRTSPEHLIKIADFGTAKLAATGSSAPENSPGALDYIAPEQIRNPQGADHRADLYSLGAVLYFLLTGQPPFQGETYREKMQLLLLDEPVRIERLRTDIDPELGVLIHQLLAKNPSERPTTGAEVAIRLDRFLGMASNVVSFELSPQYCGSNSFETDQFSDGHPIPMGDTICEFSGGHLHPAIGDDLIVIPPPENSPWEQITGANRTVTVPVPVLTKNKKNYSHFSIWKMSGLAMGMFVACAAAIGVMVKVMGK
jgi:serine/threonine protein kinase